MCILVLAWDTHPAYRLIVAANRDEYHEREAAPLAKWASPSHILAGRDLRAGGAWLGIDSQRRFGIVTNFRDLQPPQANAASRGGLIPAYLTQPEGAAAFSNALAREAENYSGFNLLLADGDELWYACNRSDRFARALPAGVHGLSNQFLDTPWPKLVRVRERFEQWLARSGNATEELFAMLADRDTCAPDADVLAAGVSEQMAQALTAPFVLHPRFGTRCSTVLLLERSGALYLAERRFDSSGAVSGETQFALAAGEWP